MPTKIENARLAILRALLDAIRQAGSILVTGHLRPDGDAVGSMIALTRLLNRSGVQAVATADRRQLGSPGLLLAGAEGFLPPASVLRKRFDLIISVDCGAFERLPGTIQPLAAQLPLMNIDHHRTNTRFGAYNWIDASASSTGEMIWRLARHARWPLDATAAEALWVAIITDTGRFAYDQTTPATLRCAADLLRHGVRTAYINDQIYGSFSRTALELKRRAFQTLTVSDHNAIASVTLAGRDFEETDGNKADAEDVIEIPRSLHGNRVALFFLGSADNRQTHVSIRTRAPLDATELAGQFGGGGHARAAGCTLPLPLHAARRRVLKAVAEWLAQQAPRAAARPAQTITGSAREASVSRAKTRART